MYTTQLYQHHVPHSRLASVYKGRKVISERKRWVASKREEQEQKEVFIYPQNMYTLDAQGIAMEKQTLAVGQ